MSEPTTTGRFALPLLAMAQAQKEVTHNEALTLLDALVAPTVEAGPQDEPPSAPEPGQAWLVGDAPSGAWLGAEGALALWTAGGWRFVAPRPGMAVLRLADGLRLRFDGALWVVPTALTGPAGGAVVDAEARAAVDALILRLAAHGLLIAG